MSKENKVLIRKWLEEMDKHNFDFIDEVFSQQFIYHLPGNPDPMKFNDYREFIPSVYAFFPDLCHEIEDLIAEDDRVVVRVRNNATHRGDFMGVSATCKEVQIGAIMIFRLAEVFVMVWGSYWA
jgi:predicted ester cyclase